MAHRDAVAHPSLPGSRTYLLPSLMAGASISGMGWTYSGTRVRDADSQGDEAKVLREMGSIDGQRLSWKHKWTRLRRWLVRR